MGKKADLLDVMARGRNAVVAWMAALTDEERSAAPGQASWGAKATLAHMAHWNLALLHALELKARGEKVPFQWEDMHGQNARLLKESAARTWAEVSAEAEGAYAALRGWAERLSEEELAAADDFAWQEGGPLWHTFLGNTYFHYLDHLAGFYEVAEQAGRAAELRALAAGVDETMGLRRE